MNQIQQLKSELQNLMTKRQDVQNQIFNLQIFGETLNQKQQQIESEIKECSIVQTFNDIHSESFLMNDKDKSVDPLPTSINVSAINPITQTIPNINMNITTNNRNQSQTLQNPHCKFTIDHSMNRLTDDVNVQDQTSNSISLNLTKDKFDFIELDSQIIGNINDSKYNPADKSQMILSEKNKKYLETLKMFQLEGNGAKHTEEVLNKMIENWVPKNQYKTKHTLTNGTIVDHSHIKSIPKAVVRLSDEVTGNSVSTVNLGFKTLEIQRTDTDEEIKKKLQLKQKYDSFIKIFKLIQPKYIQESGYCKYTDSIRKTFVFFQQMISRNKINRDSGVKPDTLKLWAKRYGYIDESILDITDFDQEF